MTDGRALDTLDVALLAAFEDHPMSEPASRAPLGPGPTNAREEDR
jgi:hypothetical protein